MSRQREETRKTFLLSRCFPVLTTMTVAPGVRKGMEGARNQGVRNQKKRRGGVLLGKRRTRHPGGVTRSSIGGEWGIRTLTLRVAIGWRTAQLRGNGAYIPRHRCG